jgi:hypothetical protein
MCYLSSCVRGILSNANSPGVFMLQPNSHTRSYTPPSEPLRRPRQPTDAELATSIINTYHPVLSESVHEKLTKRVLEHIDFLRSAFPEIEGVRGKRILDVACGSRNYPDNQNHLYEPWMLRLLCHLGAECVGVDISPQTDEPFSSYSVDLLEPNALSILPTKSFDAYYICAFPTRRVVTTMATSGPRWEVVRDDILTHLSRCLKSDGRIIRTFTTETEKYVEEKSKAALPPTPALSPDCYLPHITRGNDFRNINDLFLD